LVKIEAHEQSRQQSRVAASLDQLPGYAEAA
jgi:hypothetical protein